jgi:hypothetical protein
VVRCLRKGVFGETGQLVLSAACERNGSYDRAPSERSIGFDRAGGATESVSGRFRRVRVLRLNRPARTLTEPWVLGRPEWISHSRRVRRIEPQLAAAAPTAPRFEADVAIIERWWSSGALVDCCSSRPALVADLAERAGYERQSGESPALEGRQARGVPVLTTSIGCRDW